MKSKKYALRIKEAALERGITLSSIAKQLGIPRSNMSGIASGSRGVSLKVLKRICRILDCCLDELIAPEKHGPIFKHKKMQFLLEIIEHSNYDGIDKTWVDRVMLARIMHYRAARRKD